MAKFKSTLTLTLKQLRKVADKMMESKTASIADAVSILKAQRKVQRKVQQNARKARSRRYKAQAKGIHSCLACGASTTPRQAAIVAFKLVNGVEGSIVGRVCNSHKVGSDWRGVGSIVSLMEPKTLEREAGAQFYSLPVALGRGRETSSQAPKVNVQTVSDALRGTLALVSDEPLTAKTIAGSSKLSLSTIRKHLASLVKLGHVKRGPRIDRSGSFKLAS